MASWTKCRADKVSLNCAKCLTGHLAGRHSCCTALQPYGNRLILALGEQTLVLVMIGNRGDFLQVFSCPPHQRRCAKVLTDADIAVPRVSMRC